ncbi:Hypothetical_protein [Hexamita inflata]|uniref:Hypothetical_protein n=1 Tax=Hexamita inflata TaxID=28002 RepID=A0AA86QKZ2_9EUKA|nr:Hypothetical protein HINF_LOCUS43342 [Hexamita inflata]
MKDVYEQYVITDNKKQFFTSKLMNQDPLKQYKRIEQRYKQQVNVISFIRKYCQHYSNDSIISNNNDAVTQELKFPSYYIEQQTPKTFQLSSDISHSYVDDDDLELFSSSSEQIMECCNYENLDTQQKYHSNVQQQQLIFQLNQKFLAYE